MWKGNANPETMSLSESVQAIPERLPAGLDYSALGSRFESITQKRSIHIQPASGNTLPPRGSAF